jgi:hypothetical protein
VLCAQSPRLDTNARFPDELALAPIPNLKLQRDVDLYSIVWWLVPSTGRPARHEPPFPVCESRNVHSFEQDRNPSQITTPTTRQCIHRSCHHHANAFKYIALGACSPTMHHLL